jgi:hypothetical protein
MAFADLARSRVPKAIYTCNREYETREIWAKWIDYKERLKAAAEIETPVNQVKLAPKKTDSFWERYNALPAAERKTLEQRIVDKMPAFQRTLYRRSIQEGKQVSDMPTLSHTFRAIGMQILKESEAT